MSDKINWKPRILALVFVWAIATGNLINAYEIINSSAASAFSFIILFYILPVLVMVNID